MTKKSPAQIFRTPSGLELDECYEATADCKELNAKLGKPGSYPFTRGIHNSMYRGKLWTMRQYAGFGTAAEANKRYHYLLQHGVTGLSVAFDLPTQMGRDSDHPLVQGEVGRVGVAIATTADIEQLFDKIPFEDVSISMTINATAAILLAFTLVCAERRGIAWNKLRGTIQNDILKEYVARGTYIYPPREALRIVTDIFAFCSKEVPQWNTISISGYHIREAGSTAVQEVGFTLADGIAYVDAALKAGLTIDEFAPRLAFFFNCHNDFLEEIAKFRAARRLWARIVRDRFKSQDPKSQMLRFHTQTAGSSLTAQQPLNNVSRTTIQALAAVLGGTQSLHTNAYDEALALPTEESARVALRTQQIIAYESGVANTVDPLAGSFVIENLTDRIEAEAEKLIQRIDALGGMVSAIEIGFPQDEIQQAAYEYQRRIDDDQQVIVGVNQFASTEEVALPMLKIDPASERAQRERLAAFRETRDPASVANALKALADRVTGGKNVMPGIVEAARVGGTLGEISDVFRTLYGEFHQGTVPG
jgi:methylmalonyl-CoA mutase N-terminal domain/subunit